MFQDIGVSKTLIMEYEKYCENHHVNGIGTIDLQNISHQKIFGISFS
jgi:hypothetical protein